MRCATARATTTTTAITDNNNSISLCGHPKLQLKGFKFYIDGFTQAMCYFSFVSNFAVDALPVAKFSSFSFSVMHLLTFSFLLYFLHSTKENMMMCVTSVFLVHSHVEVNNKKTQNLMEFA